jgi:hypothetical protein
MRIIYTLLALAPAPLFAILGVISLYTNHHSICTSGTWIIPEMALMWWIMSLAHLTPWILKLQQVYLTRH